MIEDVLSLSDQKNPTQIDIREASFSPEQEQIADAARIRAVEWLGLGQFGALKYNIGQMASIRAVLLDVKGSLFTGKHTNRHIHKSSRFAICEIYGGENGSQLEIRSTEDGSDLACSLYRRLFSPMERFRQAIQALEQSARHPFSEDSELLLEFFRLRPPLPTYGNTDEWVKRILELDTKDSLLLRVLPVSVLEKRKSYPYGARWATEEHNDLLVVTDPGRSSHVNYVLRLIAQRDGDLVLARRANFNPSDRPKNLQKRS